MPNESAGRATIQTPYPLAMVVCDMIWQDPGSGKRTLLGCFSNILANQFPASHPIMAVYVAITDGRGKVPVRLQLEPPDEQSEPVWKSDDLEVDFEDPRVVIEINFYIKNLTFPGPGEYRFQLFAAGEPLMERRLVVIDVGKETP